MSNKHEKTSKREAIELLHNTLGVMAAELADAENGFHQGKQCSVHSEMQSSQIWVSSFSLQMNTSGSRGDNSHRLGCAISSGYFFG